MNTSNVATFGSAAIATPPAADTGNTKRDDKPAEAAPAQQAVQAAKPEGTGRFVDINV